MKDDKRRHMQEKVFFSFQAVHIAVSSTVHTIKWAVIFMIALRIPDPLRIALQFQIAV